MSIGKRISRPVLVESDLWVGAPAKKWWFRFFIFVAAVRVAIVLYFYFLFSGPVMWVSVRVGHFDRSVVRPVGLFYLVPGLMLTGLGFAF